MTLVLRSSELSVTASDAIKYLEENNVDLVISDIRMVQVSGIDLAQYIYENKPWTQVILLSGYTDFEYAKSGY